MRRLISVASRVKAKHVTASINVYSAVEEFQCQGVPVTVVVRRLPSLEFGVETKYVTGSINVPYEQKASSSMFSLLKEGRQGFNQVERKLTLRLLFSRKKIDK